MKTSTGYGTKPWLGMATTSTVDPGGLNLTTTIGYEPLTDAANKWLRCLTRTISGWPAQSIDPVKGSVTNAYDWHRRAL